MMHGQENIKSSSVVELFGFTLGKLTFILISREVGHSVIYLYVDIERRSLAVL